jgi:1-deoxy-D-xylulose-5-phosphate synthase
MKKACPVFPQARKDANVRLQCGVLCTFEDHVIMHGCGTAVIEHLHSACIQTPVEHIYWPDDFGEHGKPDILRKLHGLTLENVIVRILARLA